MKQQEDFISESTELNEDSEAMFNSLQSLLLDLLIDDDKDNVAVVSSSQLSTTNGHSENLPIPPTVASPTNGHVITLPLTDDTLVLHNLVTLDENSPELLGEVISPEEIGEKSDKQTEISLIPYQVEHQEQLRASEKEETLVPAENLPNVVNPLERLQSLLVGNNMKEFQQIVIQLKEKLNHLENQIYTPENLLNLLMPLIAELLKIDVSEARAAFINEAAIIIGEMLQQKVEHHRDQVGGLLAPLISVAIREQIKECPEEIAEAIGPTMGKAIQEQIKLEKDAMVDALYPVIGSTIAKYMAETIRWINQQIENTFTLQGVYRKIRSKVQGVSEAELILKDIPFRVQAIFLIHKGSGLVIAEVQQSGDEQLEAEMLAGMLTAIRSFVNDCIAQTGSESELDKIDYGNSKIILEVAGYCYLAIVVKGEPSQNFIRKMREAMGTIVQSYGNPIEAFDGDPSSIPPQVSIILENLRDLELQEGKKRNFLPMITITLVILGIIGTWGFYQYRDRTKSLVQAEISDALISVPELSVYRLNVEINGDTLKLSGRVPTQYLRNQAEKTVLLNLPLAFKLDNQIVPVEVPPDPVLTAKEVKRLTSIFNNMTGVAISAQYTPPGKVTIEGILSERTDAKKITQAFEKIPGVHSVTNSAHVQEIGLGTRIYFETGSVKLKPTEMQKISQLKIFLKRYSGKYFRLIGYSDRSGNSTENQVLALERAKVVRDTLVAGGMDAKHLQIVGTNQAPLDLDEEEPLWVSRCVEIEAIPPDVRDK